MRSLSQTDGAEYTVSRVFRGGLIKASAYARLCVTHLAFCSAYFLMLSILRKIPLVLFAIDIHSISIHTMILLHIVFHRVRVISVTVDLNPNWEGHRAIIRDLPYPWGFD